MTRYASPRFPFRAPPPGEGRATVAIVGAGPIGLAMAVDLALRGVASVVLDDNDVVSTGSRAICWAKRTLEIFDRLGVAERMVAKGVTWKVGRVFHRDRELYAFDLLPEPGHRFPAFVNLQQYYVEQYLAERCADFPDLIDLRWRHRVVGLERDGDGATLAVETPAGPWRSRADWVLACDGARSAVRGLLGLDFEGEVFEERFLIADIEMKADFPEERLFWFEPPFHDGQTALMHKQPDDLWRIDLQLGWGADPEAEKRPEAVIPRIRAIVGERPFALDWVSVYAFHCRRLARFVHGPVIFVGDSAHVVSPFGARGGNGGVQDVDNLGWKLAAVLRGEAPRALVDSYDAERIHAADENILNSARSTRFMSPRDGWERRLRDETLDLAATHPFARPFVNPGRLSRPCSLAGLPLTGPDAPGLPPAAAPGMACPDAPVTGPDGAPDWLLRRLGDGFALLAVETPAPDVPGVEVVRVGPGGLGDPQGLVAARYGRGLALIRPDRHVAARWLRATEAEVAAARDRALGRGDRAAAA